MRVPRALSPTWFSARGGDLPAIESPYHAPSEKSINFVLVPRRRDKPRGDRGGTEAFRRVSFSRWLGGAFRHCVYAKALLGNGVVPRLGLYLFRERLQNRQPLAVQQFQVPPPTPEGNAGNQQDEPQSNAMRKIS